MDDRLECLKLSISQGGSIEEVLENANIFWDYLNFKSSNSDFPSKRECTPRPHPDILASKDL